MQQGDLTVPALLQPKRACVAHVSNTEEKGAQATESARSSSSRRTKRCGGKGQFPYWSGKQTS